MSFEGLRAMTECIIEAEALSVWRSIHSLNTSFKE
jgi:hypothetical protein